MYRALLGEAVHENEPCKDWDNPSRDQMRTAARTAYDWARENATPGPTCVPSLAIALTGGESLDRVRCTEPSYSSGIQGIRRPFFPSTSVHLRSIDGVGAGQGRRDVRHPKARGGVHSVPLGRLDIPNRGRKPKMAVNPIPDGYHSVTPYLTDGRGGKAPRVRKTGLRRCRP